MVLCGSVYWGVDVIVSVEDKGCQYTRVISLLRTKVRGRQQSHSYVTNKMSIAQYGNILLLIPLLGIRPFMLRITAFSEQPLRIKGASCSWGIPSCIHELPPNPLTENSCHESIGFMLISAPAPLLDCSHGVSSFCQSSQSLKASRETPSPSQESTSWLSFGISARNRWHKCPGFLLLCAPVFPAHQRLAQSWLFPIFSQLQSGATNMPAQPTRTGLLSWQSTHPNLRL